MGLDQGDSFCAAAGRAKRRLAGALSLGLLLGAAALVPEARATEAGYSFYLLGSGVPDAAVMPPLRGVYFDNTFIYYEGSANKSRDFEIGGQIVAGVTGRSAANFSTVVWVPTTNFFGATASIGGALPLGHVATQVDTVISTPVGNDFGVSLSNDQFLVGDPVGVGALGWKWGNHHLAVTETLNVPIGSYQERNLANLAFHRWIGDTSLAYTWKDEKSGWDVSAKAGVTFNGTNPYTDYATGTESHYELGAQKTLTKAFSVGIQSYYFFQVTGDGGTGNHVGPFEGRTTAVGGNVAYSFNFFARPATLRFRGLQEFNAINRLQGNSFWLDLSFPIKMDMPPMPAGAAPHAW